MHCDPERKEEHAKMAFFFLQNLYFFYQNTTLLIQLFFKNNKTDIPWGAISILKFAKMKFDWK